MNFLREWMWHGDIYIHNRHPTSAGSICLPASSFVLQRSSSALLHVLQPDNVCICVRASVWVSGWMGVFKCVCVSVEGHVQVHPSFQDRLCLLLICAFSWCTSAPPPPVNLCKHQRQQLFYFGAKNSWECKQQCSRQKLALSLNHALENRVTGCRSTTAYERYCKAIEFRFQLPHFQLCDSRTTGHLTRIMWKPELRFFQSAAKEIRARLFRINTATWVPGQKNAIKGSKRNYKQAKQLNFIFGNPLTSFAKKGKWLSNWTKAQAIKN